MSKDLEIFVSTEEEVTLPFYASLEASGADLCAHLDKPLILLPRQRALIPTGLRLQIPKGYEVQVRPRSGLAWKHGITVLNTPGTIDSDFRGEIQVILINLGEEPFQIVNKMRIAQLVVQPVVSASFRKTEELVATARGSGGFGHTGV